MMTTLRWMCTALAVVVFGIGAAQADGLLTPIHGGRMAESHGQRLELVIQGETAALYLTDHDNRPVSSDGMTGKVVLLVNGQKVEVGLQPAGANQLRGEVAHPIAAFESAVITVMRRGGNSLSARIAAHH